MSYFSYLSLFLLLTLIPLCPGYKLNAFYANWDGYNGYPVSLIPGEKISRIFYDAFFMSLQANPDGSLIPGCQFDDPYMDLQKVGPIDGVFGDTDQSWNDPLRGNMYQFMQFKKRYPHVQIIAAISGGYDMHEDMLQQSNTDLWAQGCLNLLQTYPTVFDGVNINLQYPCVNNDPNCNGIIPSPNDEAAFTNFVKTFKDTLPAGSYLSLTLSPEELKHEALDFASLNFLVDEYLLQTYNMADGAWDSYTGHHTPPHSNPNDPEVVRQTFNVEDALNSLIQKGAPPQKIIIGAAFYGRGFQIGTNSQDNGVFTLSNGELSIGTVYGGSVEQNIFLYWDIKTNYMANYQFDSVAMAPYIRDNVNGVFISFDDVTSITEKVRMVQKLGLGGIFIWEISMDLNNELIEAAQPVCSPQYDCQRPSKEIPGGLTLDETPQFIILQMEDSILDTDFLNEDQLTRLLKNGDPTYPILDSLGCIPRFTGYFSGRLGDYNMINYAYRTGSVAMRGYTMTTSLSTGPATWQQELSSLQSDFNYLAQATPVGSRAPFFQANEFYYEQLYNMGIKFDSSMIWNDGFTKQAYWPFTLDYPDLIDQNLCNFKGACPTQSYPGLWEFPLDSFNYDDPESYFNYYVIDSNYDDMLTAFQANFLDSYTFNKAPRAINLRWKYFVDPHTNELIEIKQQFVLEFLNWITTGRSDVIFATESQVIDWIKNPIPLAQLQQNWAKTCPDPTLTPENSCAGGVLEQCFYQTLSYVVCGSNCPNLVPDISTSYSLVGDPGDLLLNMCPVINGRYGCQPSVTVINSTTDDTNSTTDDTNSTTDDTNTSTTNSSGTTPNSSSTAGSSGTTTGSSTTGSGGTTTNSSGSGNSSTTGSNGTTTNSSGSGSSTAGSSTTGSGSTTTNSSGSGNSSTTGSNDTTTNSSGSSTTGSSNGTTTASSNSSSSGNGSSTTGSNGTSSSNATTTPPPPLPTTPWNGVVNITYPAPWGYTGQWTYQIEIFMYNPNPTYNATSALLSVRNCKSLGSVASAFSFPDNTIYTTDDGYDYTTKFLTTQHGGWLNVPPSNTFSLGFINFIATQQIVVENYLVFGLDLYAVPLSCGATTCNTYCGNTTGCTMSQPFGPANCNSNCNTLLGCSAGNLPWTGVVHMNYTSWGYPGSYTYQVDFYMTNPQPTVNPVAALFSLNYCNSLSISVAYGFPDNTLYTTTNGNMVNNKFLINQSGWIKPGTFHLGELMILAAKNNLVLENLIVFGLDLYATALPCTVNTCNVYCGRSNCMASQATNCNSACSSLLQCS